MGTTSAVDLSSNGNTGWLINGVRKVAGKIGQGLKFDGTNDYVNVANESNFDFERTDSFSIASWVKSSSVANVQILVEKTNGPTDYNGYYTLLRDNGKFELYIQAGSGIDINVQGGTLVSNGQWHNVVAVYAGTSLASGVTLYVDGKAETPTVVQDDLGTNSILNNATIEIGARDTGTQLQLNGFIDDVRVYNRVLSATEVRRLYLLGR